MDPSSRPSEYLVACAGHDDVVCSCICHYLSYPFSHLDEECEGVSSLFSVFFSSVFLLCITASKRCKDFSIDSLSLAYSRKISEFSDTAELGRCLMLFPVSLSNSQTLFGFAQTHSLEHPFASTDECGNRMVPSVIDLRKLANVQIYDRI